MHSMPRVSSASHSTASTVDSRSPAGARYAYEMQQNNVLYGFVVEASIGKGNDPIDRYPCPRRRRQRRAGSHPITTRLPRGTGNHREAHPVLTGAQVTRYGEPVAFVVAESFERGQGAAYLVE